MPFNPYSNQLNASQVNEPDLAPWLTQNSQGNALGRIGSALGPIGSALGGGASFFNTGNLNTGIRGAATPSVVSGPGSLYGGAMPGSSQFGLDPAMKGGKAGGLKDMFSGMNIANMGVGLANAAGLPQAMLGRRAGGALGSGASGALSGLALSGGNPIGGAVGGGLGMLTSLLGGGGQRRPPPQVPVTPAGPDLYSNY